MSDRTLIFNAKGAQIGYIEADRALDLTGRERCKYARATGNLSDLNDEKIVGHVSLDGTFVGLCWISDELFGKPSGGVRGAHLWIYSARSDWEVHCHHSTTRALR
jgi:hypothetical protein